MNLLPTKRLAFAKVVEEYDIESGIIDIIIHHVNEIWRALPIAYKQFAEWKWMDSHEMNQRDPDRHQHRRRRRITHPGGQDRRQQPIGNQDASRPSADQPIANRPEQNNESQILPE